MSKKPNMLSTQTPWNLVATGYAEVSMKMLEAYTLEALELLDYKSKEHILDVACGPGTLALLAAEHAISVCALDFSASMLALFRDQIKNNKIRNIDITEGDGQALPYEDDRFDAAFSMFGLMFFPDRKKGLSEIFRTLKPGGCIAVSSWAPISQSPAMQAMFGAIRAMDPSIPEPQNDIDSLENPAVFAAELNAAGFKETQVHLVTKHFAITSLPEFWSNMVKGSAPIVMMKNTMAPAAWAEKEKIAINYLGETLSPMPESLSSDAWIGCGGKPSRVGT